MRGRVFERPRFKIEHNNRSLRDSGTGGAVRLIPPIMARPSSWDNVALVKYNGRDARHVLPTLQRLDDAERLFAGKSICVTSRHDAFGIQTNRVLTEHLLSGGFGPHQDDEGVPNVRPKAR